MRSRLKRVRLVGFEIEGINVGESSIQSGNEGTVRSLAAKRRPVDAAAKDGFETRNQFPFVVAKPDLVDRLVRV